MCHCLTRVGALPVLAETWGFLVLEVVVSFLQKRAAHSRASMQWQWDMVLHGVVGVQLCFP